MDLNELAAAALLAASDDSTSAAAPSGPGSPQKRVTRRQQQQQQQQQQLQQANKAAGAPSGTAAKREDRQDTSAVPPSPSNFSGFQASSGSQSIHQQGHGATVAGAHQSGHALNASTGPSTHIAPLNVHIQPPQYGNFRHQQQQQQQVFAASPQSNNLMMSLPPLPPSSFLNAGMGGMNGYQHDDFSAASTLQGLTTNSASGHGDGSPHLSTNGGQATPQISSFLQALHQPHPQQSHPHPYYTLPAMPELMFDASSSGTTATGGCLEDSNLPSGQADMPQFYPTFDEAGLYNYQQQLSHSEISKKSSQQQTTMQLQQAPQLHQQQSSYYSQHSLPSPHFQQQPNHLMQHTADHTLHQKQSSNIQGVAADMSQASPAASFATASSSSTPAAMNAPLGGSSLLQNDVKSLSTKGVGDGDPPARKQKGRRPSQTGAENKQHRCSYEGCVWSFNRREHLKRHENTHNPQNRPFLCDIPYCGLRFSRLDNLNSHRKTHEKGKRTTQWHGAKLAIHSLDSTSADFVSTNDPGGHAQMSPQAINDNFASGLNFSSSGPTVNGALDIPSETPFLNLGLETDEYGIPRSNLGDYRSLHLNMLPVMPEIDSQAAGNVASDLFNPNDFSNRMYSQMATRRRKRGGQMTPSNNSSKRSTQNGTSEYNTSNGYAEGYEPDDASRMYTVGV